MKIYLQFVLVIFLSIIINPYLTSQELLEVEGATIIQNADDASPEPGTIRWTGIDF